MLELVFENAFRIPDHSSDPSQSLSWKRMLAFAVISSSALSLLKEVGNSILKGGPHWDAQVLISLSIRSQGLSSSSLCPGALRVKVFSNACSDGMAHLAQY